jgi:uncharacterized membrane protein YkvA (DUF1232 family)
VFKTGNGMVRLIRLWGRCGRDLRVLSFALRHAGKPVWLWPAAVLMALYVTEPFNLAIPALGVVDDLFLFPLVLHALLKCLPSQIHSDFAASAGSASLAQRSKRFF